LNQKDHFFQNVRGRAGRYGTGRNSSGFSDTQAVQTGTDQKRFAKRLGDQSETGQNRYSNKKADQYGTLKKQTPYSDPNRSSAVNPFVRDKEWRETN